MQRSVILPIMKGPFFGYKGQSSGPSPGLVNRFTGHYIPDVIPPNYPSGYGMNRNKKQYPYKKKKTKINPLKKLLKKR